MTDTDPIYGSVAGRYGNISFFNRDPVVGRALKTYGEWAQLEIDFCRLFIGNGNTVLDVGGFVGTHSIAFSRMVGSEGQVLCFEPQKASYDVIAHNLAANSIQNVYLHQAAVGKETKSIEIFGLDLGLTFNFGSHAIHSDLGTATTSFKDTVRQVTIDSLGLKNCHFIKLDIEGMECEAIEGARGTIGECSPVIFAECNTVETGSAVLRSLREHGYKTYAHLADAFNPQNFLQSGHNIFGSGRELSILAVPFGHWFIEHKLTFPGSNLCVVETLDDLVYAILQKPQYVNEILSTSHAARSNGSLPSATEVPDLKQRLKEHETIIRHLSDLAAAAKNLVSALETKIECLLDRLKEFSNEAPSSQPISERNSANDECKC